jgi:UDP-N-acetylmuramyl pentapeptide phosphotransferase/UDP-N-acetylglucosamine-1-phosphate transferase
MDGINGITGVYALVTLLTFLYIDRVIAPFTNATFILATVVAVLVFLFFNFRTKARCFAGDIGSVSLAFLQVFLLLQLIDATGNYGWALLFLVFGVDAVITIVYRIKRKENIFKAHRSHLYQYLSNELKLPHLWVSSAYGILQLVVNILVIHYFQKLGVATIGFLLAYVLVYWIVRESLLRKIARPGFFQKLS